MSELDENQSFSFEEASLLKAKESDSARPYCVLARKYRPKTFSSLIGQDTLVKTLTNAIQSNRIAQAYILTGIRGIGKTSTARIIARALNCTGVDGNGTEPTTEPCGVCSNCRAIENDNHVDVFEMDAASRTGVDDIREILDSVRYKPSVARYKIYVIDEVHMLSKNAFNALLKTLEEPPPHVKFIFATTEIRKVLPTILSRCQRFDLKRVEDVVLAKHFENIAGLEKVAIDKEAVAIIAKIADGSVRDGLSLLDGIIAHSSGTSAITAEDVRKIIGLADKSVLFDIFEALMKGETAKAIDLFAMQHDLGADPLNILQDLLELTHFITKAKIAPETINNPAVAEEDRKRGKEMADKLPMSVLTRCFQMLLKGIDETKTAYTPFMTAEMCLIRIAFVSDLPTPEKAILDLKKKAITSSLSSVSAPAVNNTKADISHNNFEPKLPNNVVDLNSSRAVSNEKNSKNINDAPEISSGNQAKSDVNISKEPQIKNFWDIQAVFMKNREMLIAHSFSNDVIPVAIEGNIIKIALKNNKAAPDFAYKLSEKLSALLGADYKFVIVESQEGVKTLAEQTVILEEKRKQDIAAVPIIRKVLEAFPNSEIESITNNNDNDESEKEDNEDKSFYVEDEK
ncbi:MAG: DNA polymerase III subunit gamma/tau [Alphaproteobacteria bacterium]